MGVRFSRCLRQAPWLTPLKIRTNIAALELLQARLERKLQALGVVALVVRKYTVWWTEERLLLTCGKLGGHDHLVPTVSFCQPLSKPHLGLSELIVVGRINEVSSLKAEGVQYIERCILGTFIEVLTPVVAKVHGAKAQWRDTKTRRR